MTEQEALAFLYQFINYEDKSQRQRGPGFTLAGMRCLLAALDHPHQAYPSVIVAGTKGKGSTSAMLASILSAAGYRTGFYSQPHLQHWRERIRIDGQLIEPNGLIAAVERLQALLPSLPQRCPAISQPTYYEAGTAVAFLHFASAAVDLAVLEVGLGGRLDSVNVVTPLVTAITPISLDHTDVLGTTLAAIAGEKAGIIKPAVPVVVAPQPDEAAVVIERRAREVGAPLIWATERASLERADDPAGPAALEGRQAVRVALPASLGHAPGSPERCVIDLPLLGHHQLLNAGTALAIAEQLALTGRPIAGQAALDGLARVCWPGRLEILQRSPLIIADGAHTPSSAAVLRTALADHFPGRPVTLILAVSNDKDLDGIAAELVPVAKRILVTTYGAARSAPIERLAAALQRAGGQPERAPDLPGALAMAQASATPAGLVCATGSLVTVGEIRRLLGHPSG